MNKEIVEQYLSAKEALDKFRDVAQAIYERYTQAEQQVYAEFKKKYNLTWCGYSNSYQFLAIYIDDFDISETYDEFFIVSWRTRRDDESYYGKFSVAYDVANQQKFIDAFAKERMEYLEQAKREKEAKALKAKEQQIERLTAELERLKAKQ